jgi:hypothetical protein
MYYSTSNVERNGLEPIPLSAVEKYNSSHTMIAHYIIGYNLSFI